jgi:hypothetical protein
LADFAI